MTEPRQNYHDPTNPVDWRTTAGRIGRSLRIVLGALLIVSIIGIYLRGTWKLNLSSIGVAVGLAALYMFIGVFVPASLTKFSAWFGAILVFMPLIAMYILGMGGGLIFGQGEGQLGAITFLGTSLVLAGLRGDPGCEVMSIPNAVFRKQSHLACLLFSPVDWLEKRFSREK